MTATRHFISSYFSHYEKRASLSYNINTAVVSGYRTNNFNSVHEFIGQTQPTEYKLIIYYTHFVDRNSTAVKWGKTKKWQTCTLNMNRSSVSIKSMPAEIQQQFFFFLKWTSVIHRHSPQTKRSRQQAFWVYTAASNGRVLTQLQTRNSPTLPWSRQMFVPYLTRHEYVILT